MSSWISKIKRVIINVAVAISALRTFGLRHNTIGRDEAGHEGVVVAGVVVQQAAPVLDLSG